MVPWRFLLVFAGLAIASLAATLLVDDTLVHIFESFYRYGYLVFGGGQVVVPLMYNEMVSLREYVTHPEFLTGYGLVQGLPGPRFSFSAYIGGMIAAAALILLEKSGFAPDNLLVTVLTLVLLLSWKVPAPLIVAMVLIGGGFNEEKRFG